MFTFPAGIMSNRAPNPWAGWTGVADGSTYSVATDQSYNGIAVFAINSTQFIYLAIYNSDNSIYGWVATITGTSVSYGPRQNFIGASPANNNISICQLSGGFFVFTYSQVGLNNTVVQLNSVAGNTITSYTPVVVDASSDRENSAMEIATLTSSTAIMYYYDGSANCNIVVITRSGSSLLVGTPYSLGSSNVYSAISAISSTQILLSGVGGTEIVAIGATISGTTIASVGSVANLASLSGFSAALCTQSAIGTNGAIVSYSAQSTTPPNYSQMNAVYLTVASNVITTHSPVQTVAPETTVVNLWTESLNSINTMCIYYDGTNVVGLVLSLTGHLIVPANSSVTIVPNLTMLLTGQPVLSQLDPVTLVLGYLDNSGFPFSIILKNA